MLKVAQPRDIVVRLLENLKYAYECRGELGHALLVTDRLITVASSVELRRDRGLYALALGGRAPAIEDLDAYLHARPTAPDSAAVRQALARAHQRSTRLFA
jgi:regulator of sirC expression with transglutaminase-like and TPR domain